MKYGADQVVVKNLACALLWLAAVIRVRITLRHPTRHMWSWSLAGALTCLAMTATALIYPNLFDRFSPNLYGIVSHSASSLGLAFVGIWLVTLLHQTPSKRLAKALLAAGSFMVLEQVVLWLIADVHDHEVNDLSTAPDATRALLWYYMTYYIWGCLMIGASAVISWRLATQPGPRPRTVRLGLTLISCASVLTCAVLVFTAARTWLGQTGHHAHKSTFIVVSEALILPAIAGFPIGVLLTTAGPRITSRLKARRTLRDLTPLHRALIARTPHVQLPSTGAIERSPSRVLTRLLIEIHDGLDALTTPSPAPQVDDVVLALRAPHPSQGAFPASLVISSASTPEEELDVLIEIARKLETSHHLPPVEATRT